jgi:resuscitation-promoting factor RpfB
VRSILSGRKGRIAIQAAILAAVVGGTVQYAQNDEVVTLVVDGQTREVHTTGTVSAVLAAEHITLNEHDLVAPAPGTKVEDGGRIVVQYSRELVLTVDGQTRTYWVTDRTVQSALTALGVRTEQARLSVSRSREIDRSGLSLTVSTPKSVRIVADGAVHDVRSTAPTVADLLAEQGIGLRPEDRLSVLAITSVTDGLVVGVTRVDRRTVTVEEKIPYQTTKKKTDTLYTGQTKVVEAGKNGSRKATYTVGYANGQETGRTLVSETVLVEPVSRVVKVGTKTRSYSSDVGGDVDSLNWNALAQCESSGNPRAVNPAGYYGLYQFSLSTWRSVGGSGNPIDASPSEQTYRAKLLYQKAGAGQWGCGARLYS